MDRDPGLIRCFEYTNNTCDPTTDEGASCTQGYYPEYVVNVTNEADVSAAVRFARDNNVRLNVKNTGHVSLAVCIPLGQFRPLSVPGFYWAEYSAWISECVDCKLAGD